MVSAQTQDRETAADRQTDRLAEKDVGGPGASMRFLEYLNHVPCIQVPVVKCFLGVSWRVLFLVCLLAPGEPSTDDHEIHGCTCWKSPVILSFEEWQERERNHHATGLTWRGSGETGLWRQEQWREEERAMVGGGGQEGSFMRGYIACAVAI